MAHTHSGEEVANTFHPRGAGQFAASVNGVGGAQTSHT